MNFFVSYTGSDVAWAEWIGWELEQAGHQVIVQAWDFRPGHDFVHEMNEATQRAERTIAVLSPAYLSSSEFGEAEWRAAFVDDPSGHLRRLIPVRVSECKPHGLLKTRVYVDLVGRPESAARQTLLDGVREGDGRPSTAPRFPGGRGTGRTGAGGEPSRPRFPGALPPVFTVPFTANPLFAGRERDLAELDRIMTAAPRRPLVVITGTGGIGKTALAMEYAHAQHSRYEVVWWLRAQEPSALLADLGGLAVHPGLPDPPGMPGLAGFDEQVAAARDWLERHDQWLLILDNVDNPAALRDVLPRAGTGHVLLTARPDVGWPPGTPLLDLTVLDLDAAAAFLVERSGQPGRQAARELAEELGRLPLALEQAGGYLSDTGGVTLTDYRELFRTRAAELLGRGQALDRQDTVATTWSLALERLTDTAPGAVALLHLAAYLASDDVPLTLLTDHPDLLSEPLGQLATDPLARHEALHALRRHGLIKTSGDALSVHRLLQTVIRHQLAADQQQQYIELAVRLLMAAFPHDPMTDWRAWPTNQRLLPHLMAAKTHAEAADACGSDVSWLLDRAATYLQTQGQLHLARDLFTHALDLAVATVGPDHPDTAGYRANLALVLADLGYLPDAREQLQQALDVALATLGPDHPSAATLRDNLGGVLADLGDLQGAREQHQQSLDITLAARGPEHPDTGIRRNNLGGVLAELGDLEGAREQLQRALEITLAALGPDHPDTGIRRNNLSYLLRQLGDLEGAREQVQQALDITLAALGSDHPDTAVRRSNLGSVLRELGDLEGARDQHQEALDVTLAALGPDHPNTAVCRGNLDMVLAELEKLKRAREQHQRAREQ